jgi:hypothetical protein
MFNESFVTHGKGSQPLQDGIYVVNGTYGLENMAQLVGMTGVSDIWAGMAVWLAVVLAAVVVAIQVFFGGQWLFRQIAGEEKEDLRHKSLPFTVGNIVRMVFSYFLLPISAFSFFQFVVAGRSPVATVVVAVVLLVILVAFAGWLLYVVISSKPRAYLFDDLPTVLLYGSLYNTYSDNAAPFALIPVLLTFIRGIAIGAVQPSGIAQIVLLAICEVITILTLHAFRPFHSPTSMNAYHTIFAAVRFSTILLMVAFAPSLGVTDGPKAWIGYAILLLHLLVLVLGFFLNAVQKIVEVVARALGLGIDDNKGIAKVLGMRQLSRRLPRAADTSRQSQSSTAAMMSKGNPPGVMNGRSMSAGSANLLLGPRDNERQSGEQISLQPEGLDGSAYTPVTGDASSFSFLPSAAGSVAPTHPSGRGVALALNTAGTADPYYRPPRPRRPTVDALSPGAKSRSSWASTEWGTAQHHSRGPSSTVADANEVPLGSVSGRATPSSSFMVAEGYETKRAQTDYTTREVDFYYGVRGPALNANVPSRRLRTGPVDPTNPVSSATGWFRSLITGGKTKEKGKGFEVVRSARMPPGMDPSQRPGVETPPEGIPVVAPGDGRREFDEFDEPSSSKKKVPEVKKDRAAAQPMIAPRADEAESGDEDEYDASYEMSRIPDRAPALPQLDTGGSLHIPSRMPTVRDPAIAGPSDSTPLVEEELHIPRKSSRRMSSNSLPPPAGHRASVSQSSALLHPGYFHVGNQSHHRQNSEPLISLADEPSPESGLGHLDAHTRGERPTSIGRAPGGRPTVVTAASQAAGASGLEVEVEYGQGSDVSRQSSTGAGRSR